MLARHIAEDSGLDDHRVLLAVLKQFEHDTAYRADDQEYDQCYITGDTATICDRMGRAIIARYLIRAAGPGKLSLAILPATKETVSEMGHEPCRWCGRPINGD